ncbi:hypothetical protein LAZ67_11002694, partial [Cordylochernes scorpioides]
MSNSIESLSIYFYRKGAEIKLFGAIINGSIEDVEKLIKSSSDINAKFDSNKITDFNWENIGNMANGDSFEDIFLNTPHHLDTPLHLATRLGKVDIVRILVKNGAYINVRNEYGHIPLHEALLKNHFEIFLDLIEAGADCDARLGDVTPLMMASREYDTRFMKALLKKGVAIDAEDGNGNTALNYSLGGKFQNFKILYDYGADINIQNEIQVSLLADACYKEAPGVIAFLIKLGADINQKDGKGNTPLAAAMFNESDEISKILIRSGAKINLKNEMGDTPLNGAAYALNPTIIHSLIEAGADVNLENLNEETPIINAAFNCVKFITQGDFETADLRTLEILLRNSDNIDLFDFLYNIEIDNDFSAWSFIIQLMIMYFVLRHPTINKPEDIHLPESLCDWWKDCQSQVQLMQSQILGRSSISLYRFLTETDKSKLVGYQSNDATGLREALGKICHLNDEIYSIYKYFIMASFYENGASVISLAHCFSLAKKREFTKANKFLILKIVKQLPIWNREDYIHTYITAEDIDKLIKSGSDINAKFDRRRMVEFNQKDIGNMENEDSFEDIIKNNLYHFDTPLHLATRLGKVEIVRILFKNGAYINVRNEYGHTPLHEALLKNHFEIFLDLIEAGADCNTRLVRETPLMMASQKYDTRFMKALLKKGVDIDAKDSSGNTAINYSLGRNFQNFKILYDSGAKINIQNEMKRSLLLDACFTKSPEVVAFMIKLGADVNQKDLYGNTPLALSNESGEITKLLIHTGAIIDSKNNFGDTPLHRAAYALKPSIIQTLIEAGADVNLKNRSGKTPFIMAATQFLNLFGMNGACATRLLISFRKGAEIKLFGAIINGSIEDVEKLIKSSSDINAKFDSNKITDFNWENIGNMANGESFEDIFLNTPHHLDTPLHLATRLGKVDIVRILVKNGAYINVRNEYGHIPLHEALLKNHFEIFLDLIEAGADCDARLGDVTPLMMASRKYDTRYMEALLKKEVAIDAEDSNGNTALNYSLGGNFQNFKILYDSGADINIQNKKYVSLLTDACYKEAPGVIAYLIKLGTNINQKDGNGNTPLAAAMFNESDEISKILIRAGAEINFKNEIGDTPLNRAAYTLNPNIIQSLIEAGADVNLENLNRKTPIINAALNCVKFISRGDFETEHLRTLETLLRNSDDIDLMAFLRNIEIDYDFFVWPFFIQLMIMYFVLRHPTINKPEDIHLPESLCDWWKECQIQ